MADYKYNTTIDAYEVDFYGYEDYTSCFIVAKVGNQTISYLDKLIFHNEDEFMSEVRYHISSCNILQDMSKGGLWIDK